MVTIYKDGLLQKYGIKIRRQTNNTISQYHKDKSRKGDKHPECTFVIGQVIQHKKRPGIKYLILNQPIQSKVSRWGVKRHCWKMKLFSIRAGTIGGKILTRHFDYQLLRNYFVIDNPELEPGQTQGVVLE